RLSVNAAGEVRVSIPAWAPYSAGLNFAKSRRAWILSQRKPAGTLADGQLVGKAHHLQFIAKSGQSKPSGRVAAGTVIVSYPLELSATDPTVQTAARKASIRALRSQAEQLLPQRLKALAETHGFSYADVKVKQLKSRWGSCDQHTNIVLNLYLMQLPWDCIDYVLLHELTHTRVLRHGPDFWQAMAAILPDVKAVRKRLRSYEPTLDSSAAPDMA
ncbi:MAG TPA: SprT family zinc-dependent metalloprotease, partial [Verrucomicrobiae bacterium]|nr:SprT family zinc-dependent metalloprotease [Verrucomicrobiae bacterium]